eukprot:CAMPEP_0194389824 /NCGR_PEP_ID=MMETSP0174-20130528/106182_1 /TAXON_ID=216777 /ORGANISM="Proboscia alata, Strain PI-D3" /LENGTH=56 /DNA_ID=CAMNT_0039182479 /DNA_START=483 /DNA_END=653 /DNA_ORIENTATION=-
MWTAPLAESIYITSAMIWDDGDEGMDISKNLSKQKMFYCVHVHILTTNELANKYVW